MMDKQRNLAHLKQFGRFLSRNSEYIDLFRKRAHFIHAIRDRLNEIGAVELEMPCLQAYRDGTPFHQFVTEHPLTGERFYLRHCMEDHLKRICNSFGMVYELGKAFRVEIEHGYKANEFTVMQFCGLEMSLRSGIDLICDVIRTSVEDTFNTCSLPTVDFSKFRVISFDEWMREKLGFGINDESWREKSALALAEYNVSVGGQLAEWEIYEVLLTRILEPSTREPTVVFNYPPVLQHVADLDSDRKFALRFSIIVSGIEVGDGGVKFAGSAGYQSVYAENAEYRKHVLGITDNEAPTEFYDDIEDYGKRVFTCGLGVDRVFALCIGKSVHEVIPFPYH